MPRRRAVPELFEPTETGLAVHLPPWLRAVLRAQGAQLLELLGGAGTADPADASSPFPPADAPPVPRDAALARLLPSGYADDANAAEFRRLTEADLRAGKRANAALLAARADAELLSWSDAQAWLLSLNDVRLAFGARLGLRADGDAESLLAQAEPGSAEAAALELFATFGLLQELLVEALDSSGH